VANIHFVVVVAMMAVEEVLVVDSSGIDHTFLTDIEVVVEEVVVLVVDSSGIDHTFLGDIEVVVLVVGSSGIDHTFLKDI
jgi:hypothetical protein